MLEPILVVRLVDVHWGVTKVLTHGHLPRLRLGSFWANRVAREAAQEAAAAACRFLRLQGLRPAEAELGWVKGVNVKVPQLGANFYLFSFLVGRFFLLR